jgi:hypothetical protein
MKLEQRSHKCVEPRGEYIEYIHFFRSRSLLVFYKAKDLSAPTLVATLECQEMAEVLTLTAINKHRIR